MIMDENETCGPAILGINPNNGNDPNDGFPKNISYTPKFLTLVRISSKGKWDITTNHASFDAPPASNPVDTAKDAEARLCRAIELFKYFKQSRNEQKRFKEIFAPGGGSGIKKRKNNDYDAIDFDDFNFGYQHDIYIWFDSSDVALHKAGGKDHLIEMTRFTAAGDTTTFNKSFYASDASAQANPALGGKVILVRNYLRDGAGNSLRDANGNPVDPLKTYPYSMNIFFELIRKGSTNLVVILDPDTGNGTGYDPLIGA